MTIRKPTDVEWRAAKAIELVRLEDRLNQGLFNPNTAPSYLDVLCARAVIGVIETTSHTVNLPAHT